MLRWMICFIVGGMLMLPANASARETRQPWQILIDSVTYLRGLPEVVWLRAEGHTLMIGWSKPPRKFRALNLTAARNASRVLPKEEVHVVSLRANQTDWHPGSEQPVICHTSAHHNEILETNC